MEWEYSVQHLDSPKQLITDQIALSSSLSLSRWLWCMAMALVVLVLFRKKRATRVEQHCRILISENRTKNKDCVWCHTQSYPLVQVVRSCRNARRNTTSCTIDVALAYPSSRLVNLVSGYTIYKIHTNFSG
jgi:hypothetical protein